MDKKPFHILYMMDYFYGTEGGTERQVLELIQSLDRSRYRPIFAVLQSSSYIEQCDFPCDVWVLDIRRMFKLSTIQKMLNFTIKLYRSKIDLVHVFFNDAAVIAPFFCKMGGARVITSRRDMGFWYSPQILKLLKISNRFVDRIAVNSRAVQSNVVAMEKYPADRIEVLRNGISSRRFESQAAPEFRQRFGIDSDAFIVGMVSNLYSVKRPEDLIMAVSLLREQINNVHLVLVGGGPREIEPLKEYVRMISMSSYVHFLGIVHDAVPIIKHFDVCVSCSESEGLSNSIIEYMGCSKPVVCTCVGGNPELVEDGVNGYLVKIGDVAALAKRIREILLSQELRKALGENGRRRYLANFTSEIMAAKYMDLYDRVSSVRLRFCR